jgi:hypothetical protein
VNATPRRAGQHPLTLPRRPRTDPIRARNQRQCSQARRPATFSLARARVSFAVVVTTPPARLPGGWRRRPGSTGTTSRWMAPRGAEALGGSLAELAVTELPGFARPACAPPPTSTAGRPTLAATPRPDHGSGRSGRSGRTGGTDRTDRTGGTDRSGRGRNRPRPRRCAPSVAATRCGGYEVRRLRGAAGTRRRLRGAASTRYEVRRLPGAAGRGPGQVAQRLQHVVVGDGGVVQRGCRGRGQLGDQLLDRGQGAGGRDGVA